MEVKEFRKSSKIGLFRELGEAAMEVKGLDQGNFVRYCYMQLLNEGKVVLRGYDHRSGCSFGAEVTVIEGDTTKFTVSIGGKLLGEQDGVSPRHLADYLSAFYTHNLIRNSSVT